MVLSVHFQTQALSSIVTEYIVRPGMATDTLSTNSGCVIAILLYPTIYLYSNELANAFDRWHQRL